MYTWTGSESVSVAVRSEHLYDQEEHRVVDWQTVHRADSRCERRVQLHCVVVCLWFCLEPWSFVVCRHYLHTGVLIMVALIVPCDRLWLWRSLYVMWLLSCCHAAWCYWLWAGLTVGNSVRCYWLWAGLTVGNSAGCYWLWAGLTVGHIYHPLPAWNLKCGFGEYQLGG